MGVRTFFEQFEVKELELVAWARTTKLVDEIRQPFLMFIILEIRETSTFKPQYGAVTILDFIPYSKSKRVPSGDTDYGVCLFQGW